MVIDGLTNTYWTKPYGTQAIYSPCICHWRIVTENMDSVYTVVMGPRRGLRFGSTAMRENLQRLMGCTQLCHYEPLLWTSRVYMYMHNTCIQLNHINGYENGSNGTAVEIEAFRTACHFYIKALGIATRFSWKNHQTSRCKHVTMDSI